MSNEIARTSDSLHEQMEWSRAMSAGNLLPKQYQNNPANLLFAAEYADTLGISRIHVLTSIAVINGRPSPSADLMSAMVRAKGHKLRVQGDDTYAEATLIRADDPDYEFTARWDETKARKAGLWGNKGPWSLYPAAMLRARAISEVVRMGASDAMAGAIYVPEELGAVVGEDGIPVEPVTQVKSQRIPSQPPSSSPAEGQSRGLDQIAAVVEPVLDADSFLARVEATTDTDELRALWSEAKDLPAGEVEDVRAIIESRVTLATQQPAETEPETEPTLDGELVEETE